MEEEKDYNLIPIDKRIQILEETLSVPNDQAHLILYLNEMDVNVSINEYFGDKDKYDVSTGDNQQLLAKMKENPEEYKQIPGQNTQPVNNMALALVNPNQPKPELSEEEQMAANEEKEMKEAKGMLGALYNTKKPKHVGDGLSSGLGNMTKGVLAGCAAVIAAPIAGAKAEGGKGFAKGLFGGIVAGVGLAGAGVCTGVYQIGRGCANTRECINEREKGKEWNSETREWYVYNLKEEAKEILEQSEEDFLADFRAKNGEGPRQEEGQRRGGNANVLSTDLYDRLGVAPDATTAQIRKAYYKKARDTHPDKNRDDPDADAKFQKIGYAYQILVDDNSRAAYDREGEEGLKNAKTMDSKAMFEMIFGSEKFEPLIGELGLAMMMTMKEGDPPELFEFK